MREIAGIYNIRSSLVVGNRMAGDVGVNGEGCSE